MSHLSQDIEDLYRKYIEDWIEGAEPVELDSFRGSLFYVKNNIIILEFNVKKKLFYIETNFHCFLDNSIGVNKVNYIIEDIFKKYFKLEECRISNNTKTDNHFRLVNIHYQLIDTLKEIRRLKRQVKNIK